MNMLKEFKVYILCLVIIVAGIGLTVGMEAKKEAELAASPDVYVAGSYTGESRGFGGKITVTITVDAKTITNVEITHKNETPGMGGKEGIEDGTYAAQIIAANGGEIEGVTRASFTTKAIKEAYALAVEQALVPATE